MAKKLQADGVDVNIEYRAYELSPNTDVEGESIYKTIPKEYFERASENLKSMGRLYDIEFNSNGNKFNTHRAHLAGEYAKTKGKYDAFVEETFKAYHTNGKNIAKIEVLNDIAESIGLNSEEMNNQINQGIFDGNLLEDKYLSAEYDVSSIPTFIINDKEKLVGAMEYERFKKAILEHEKLLP